MSTMPDGQKEEYKAEIYSYNKTIQKMSWDDACRELGEGKIKVNLLFAIKHEIQWTIFNARKHKIMESLRKVDEMHKPKET